MNNLQLHFYVSYDGAACSTTKTKVYTQLLRRQKAKSSKIKAYPVGWPVLLVPSCNIIMVHTIVAQRQLVLLIFPFSRPTSHPRWGYMEVRGQCPSIIIIIIWWLSLSSSSLQWMKSHVPFNLLLADAARRRLFHRQLSCLPLWQLLLQRCNLTLPLHTTLTTTAETFCTSPLTEYYRNKRLIVTTN